MKGKTIIIAIVFVFFLSVGILSDELKARPFHEDYGFAVNEQQLKETVRISLEREKEKIKVLRKRYGFDDKTSFSAAICPHDDYAYAAQIYAHVIPYIKAKRVIIFGVAHKAILFDFEDRLIFGNFSHWDTSCGKIKVSGIRDYLIENLEMEHYVISPGFMFSEHSIEALMHWLKYYNNDVEIVPVCVPYMNWERMQELSRAFSRILAEKMKAEGWEFGKDVAILISNDSSHYGDQGWGGKNYAPFGADIEGYVKATERDSMLAKEYLAGMVKPEKLKAFFHRLVKEDDPYVYLITWCGRFSIPFGLSTLYHTTTMLSRDVPEGKFLAYGTSVSLGLIEGTKIPLQTTAPANLHHWVGYLAMGYE